MEKGVDDADRLFANAKNKIVGCEIDGVIRGYLILSFVKGEHFIHNDMDVREIIYETPAALSNLMTFLHSQADQIDRIRISTQDESFCHLLDDPRDGSNNLIPSIYHQSNVSGVGIMYRVLDVPQVFRELGRHNFGNVNCQLKVTVDDSFLPENDGSTLVHFQDGLAQVVQQGKHQVAVELGIAHFSSLLMGTVTFDRLIQYNLAQISDPKWVDSVTRLFRTPEKPWCTTTY